MAPIKYTASGRVLVDPDGEIVAWANGLPFTAEGALAIAAADPIVFGNGIPFSQEGRMSVEADNG